MTGNRTEPRTYRYAVALTLILFAIWGLAHRLYDTLLPDFATALSLDAYQQSLAGWALSFGYYLMALPAALITRNFGYKSGVVFGLGAFAVGMFIFYPAAAGHTYAAFLLATVVIGSGLAILEVSADPLVVRMGPKETAVRRLNIAQALNPLGVLAGFYLGQYLRTISASTVTTDLAHTLVKPLFVIGAAVMAYAFLVDSAKFPPVANDCTAKNDGTTIQSFRRLIGHPLFLCGAGAQFLCSVAQVVLWAFTFRYVYAETTGIDARDVLLWSLIAFAAGRLIGTALMYKVDASILLAVFAGGGAVSSLTAATTGGQAGVAGLIAASFFLSIAFPTIFASSIRDLDGETKTGAAVLMFAAGSGAAVLALLQIIVTGPTVHDAMVIPAICFAGIAAFALHFRRTDRRLANQAALASAGKQ